MGGYQGLATIEITVSPKYYHNLKTFHTPFLYYSDTIIFHSTIRILASGDVCYRFLVWTPRIDPQIIVEDWLINKTIITGRVVKWRKKLVHS